MGFTVMKYVENIEFWAVFQTLIVFTGACSLLLLLSSAVESSIEPIDISKGIQASQVSAQEDTSNSSEIRNSVETEELVLIEEIQRIASPIVIEAPISIKVAPRRRSSLARRNSRDIYVPMGSLPGEIVASRTMSSSLEKERATGEDCHVDGVVSEATINTTVVSVESSLRNPKPPRKRSFGKPGRVLRSPIARPSGDSSRPDISTSEDCSAPITKSQSSVPVAPVTPEKIVTTMQINEENSENISLVANREAASNEIAISKDNSAQKGRIAVKAAPRMTTRSKATTKASLILG